MTPDYLETLRGVVQEAIDAGSLGAPRYLRCVAALPPGNGLEDTAGGLGDLASTWFGSEPSQCHRLGGSGAVYVTEMRQWSMGQGAIITVSRSQSGSKLDLMLVGSRGALYHEE
jgi:hypothetical protein